MIKDLNQYSEILMKNIFKIHENFQFSLLFDDISKLTKSKKIHSYCLLERSYLYGGKSIFAPFIKNGNIKDIVDFKPSQAKSRKSKLLYQLGEFYESLPLSTSTIEDNEKTMKFYGKKINSDLVIIPNVIHHCRDLGQLIELMLKENKSMKYIYIFDSYLREEHQKPNDYTRFTVSGLNQLIQKYDFELIKKNSVGNIFDGLVYLINQTEGMEKKFSELKKISNSLRKIKKQLLPLSSYKKYQKLYRKYASFSSAYSVLFKKKLSHKTENYENR